MKKRAGATLRRCIATIILALGGPAVAGAADMSIRTNVEARTASAPDIRIISPFDRLWRKSEEPIEIRFRPASDASIDRDSIRIRYGLLKIDITDKLREYGRVSEKGIYLQDVPLPEGSHHLVIEVRDTKHRVSRMHVRVTSV